MQGEAKIVTQFCTLIVNKILLPDYLKDADRETKKEELREIIDRYMNRLDRNIERIIQDPFHISLGDMSELDEELDMEGVVPFRAFRPW